jgi:hypothetical protein
VNIGFVPLRAKPFNYIAIPGLQHHVNLKREITGPLQKTRLKKQFIVLHFQEMIAAVHWRQCLDLTWTSLLLKSKIAAL